LDRDGAIGAARRRGAIFGDGARDEIVDREHL
jgi:hypothetical protein